MKPFNLEQALKDYAEGKQTVVTRDGRKVCSLLLHDANITFPVTAVMEGDDTCLSFTKDGMFWEEAEDANDLFMKEEERWVNVYFRKKSVGSDGLEIAWVEYSSQNSALQNKYNSGLSWTYLTTVKLPEENAS